MTTLLRTHGVAVAGTRSTPCSTSTASSSAASTSRIPRCKYAIEVDGYEFHTGLREFRHDRVRQNDLVDLGWTVHRFTWTEVDRLSPRVAEPDPSPPRSSFSAR